MRAKCTHKNKYHLYLTHEKVHWSNLVRFFYSTSSSPFFILFIWVDDSNVQSHWNLSHIHTHKRTHTHKYTHTYTLYVGIYTFYNFSFAIFLASICELCQERRVYASNINVNLNHSLPLVRRIVEIVISQDFYWLILL